MPPGGPSHHTPNSRQPTQRSAPLHCTGAARLILTRTYQSRDINERSSPPASADSAPLADQPPPLPPSLTTPARAVKDPGTQSSTLLREPRAAFGETPADGFFTHSVRRHSVSPECHCVTGVSLVSPECDCVTGVSLCYRSVSQPSHQPGVVLARRRIRLPIEGRS